MPLSRLDLLASLVEPCLLAVDIGTDHGYLALKLLQRGIAKQVIATDLRPLPLKQAQKTFAQANVFDGISFVVSDGLLAVTEQPDAAIIAGMGGDLAIKIMTQSLPKFQAMTQIVLQVNSHIEKVRTFVCEHGFSIIDEHITHDGFFYIALVLRYTGNPLRLSDEAAYLGTLLSVKNPLYGRYLEFECQRLTSILSQHPHATHAKQRLQWVTNKLNGQG
jgi:tRNA (adenine22-N1)-methyltransferase